MQLYQLFHAYIYISPSSMRSEHACCIFIEPQDMVVGSPSALFQGFDQPPRTPLLGYLPDKAFDRLEKNVFSQSSLYIEMFAVSPTSTLSCPSMAIISTESCSTSSSTSSSTMVTHTVADVCAGVKVTVLETIASKSSGAENRMSVLLNYTKQDPVDTVNIIYMHMKTGSTCLTCLTACTPLYCHHFH